MTPGHLAVAEILSGDDPLALIVPDLVHVFPGGLHGLPRHLCRGTGAEALAPRHMGSPAVAQRRATDEVRTLADGVSRTVPPKSLPDRVN